MPLEKSAGALLFHKNKNIEYLLLHYPPGSKTAKEYWDLPKGHIEKGEKEIDTARREVAEETGIQDIEIINGVKEHIKYFFKFRGETIFKTVTFYLAKTKTKDVKISDEHIGYKWLQYDRALKQLTFENARGVLRKAHQYLEKQ